MSIMKEQLQEKIEALANELDCKYEFVLKAWVELPSFWEIFKFEEMKDEWIKELAVVTGYTFDNLQRLYNECMEDDTYDDLRERRIDFIITTLERDW